MLTNVHERKIQIPVTAPIGTTIIISPVENAWIYIHEIMGDLASAGTLVIKTGTTTVATLALDAGQGITLTDEPGDGGVSRFKCKPGDGFSFVITGGEFNGTIDYSLRY